MRSSDYAFKAIFLAFKFYTEFDEFEASARGAGVDIDLRALLPLHVLFYEQYKDYAVISLKDYDTHPETIMLLSRENTLVYTQKQLADRDFKMFKHSIQRDFGESTVVTLLLLKASLYSCQKRFEQVNKFIDEFDEMPNPNVDDLEQNSKFLRKLTDRVEDFLDLLIWLEDRKVRQFNIPLVRYDYDVLMAKAKYLLDRCHNHRMEMQNIRNDLEVKVTRELNKRIEYLSDVVKKLTAVTILLMIPNIIASHYGMNFQKTFLSWDWQYGEMTVIAFSAVAMAAAYLLMKKRDWI